MTEDLGEIVRIVPLTFGTRAECSCGWRGKRRWHTSGAMLDAVEHAHVVHEVTEFRPREPLEPYGPCPHLPHDHCLKCGPGTLEQIAKRSK